MSTAVSVGIWIPSSLSTLQVGFMSITASPVRKERLKFQIPRRRNLEVPCWRDFEMAVGSVRSTPGSEIEKIEEICQRQSLTPIGSSLDVL